MLNKPIPLFGLLVVSLLVGCRAEPAPPQEVPAVGAPATDESANDAQPIADPADQGLETIPVTIRTAGGDHLFNVEVAATPKEQTRGLMFRESLPENGGMIFPFAMPRIASFWMRNTMIPLDMIFIRTDGSISNIARETEPYSFDSRSSTVPVIAVLEIDGGRAEELGIDAGDHVSWPGGPRLGEE